MGSAHGCSSHPFASSQGGIVHLVSKQVRASLKTIRQAGPPFTMVPDLSNALNQRLLLKPYTVGTAVAIWDDHFWSRDCLLDARRLRSQARFLPMPGKASTSRSAPCWQFGAFGNSLGYSYLDDQRILVSRPIP